MRTILAQGLRGKTKQGAPPLARLPARRDETRFVISKIIPWKTFLQHQTESDKLHHGFGTPSS